MWGKPGLLGFHSGGGNNKPSACQANPAYQDFPGGFGWFDTSSTEACQPLITLDPATNQYTGSAKTGASTPNTCGASDFQSRVGDKDVLIPIYTTVSDQSGSKTVYTITGFGAFHVLQYDMGSGGNTWKYPFPLPAGVKNICDVLPTDTFSPQGNVQACLRGYFTKYVTPADATAAAGQNFGVISISLTS